MTKTRTAHVMPADQSVRSEFADPGLAHRRKMTLDVAPAPRTALDIVAALDEMEATHDLDAFVSALIDDETLAALDGLATPPPLDMVVETAGLMAMEEGVQTTTATRAAKIAPYEMVKARPLTFPELGALHPPDAFHANPVLAHLATRPTFGIAVLLKCTTGYVAGLFDPISVRIIESGNSPSGCWCKSFHEPDLHMGTDWMPYAIAGQSLPELHFPVIRGPERVGVHLATFFEMDQRLVAMTELETCTALVEHGGVRVNCRLPKKSLLPLWTEGIYVFRIVVSEQALHVAGGSSKSAPPVACAASPFFRVKRVLPVLAYRAELEAVVRETAFAVLQNTLSP